MKYSNVDEVLDISKKELRKSQLFLAAILISIVVAIIAGIAVSQTSNIKKFNNGKCPRCSHSYSITEKDDVICFECPYCQLSTTKGSLTKRQYEKLK